MVNKIVYDYLSKYGRQYNLDDLKRKILLRGYLQKDIDESIRLLGLDNFSMAGSYYPETKEINKSQNFKWMKFGGILGLFFLIIILSSMVYGYFLFIGIILKPGFFSLSWINSIIFSVIFFLFSFLMIFFDIGFLRLGRHVNSKLIKFSSRFFMFFIILFLVLSLGVLISVSFSSPEIKERLISTFNNQSSLILKYLKIFFAVFFALFLFNLILFYLGLIRVSKKIRFSLSSGIFGWLFILGIIGLLIISIAVSGQPYYPISFNKINESGFGFYLSIYSFILGLVIIFNFLFVSLVLLSASRQFE